MCFLLGSNPPVIFFLFFGGGGAVKRTFVQGGGVVKTNKDEQGGGGGSKKSKYERTYFLNGPLGAAKFSHHCRILCSLKLFWISFLMMWYKPDWKQQVEKMLIDDA